jgi:hypothetical protein
VVREIYATGGLKDPVRRRLLETRKAFEDLWEKVAATLEDQGERTLAAEVRGFAQQLPVVGTDRQKIALRFLQFKKQQSEPQRHGMQPNSGPRARGREDDLTR